jgi:tetratricopeptide (TPR) repeat protein
MTRHRSLAPVLLASCALAVYARSFGVPFLFDDLLAIPENPAIRSLPRSFATSSETALAGRPLTSFTFALNHAAGGLSVAGYHAVNLAIHVACAWLIFEVARRLLAAPRVGAREADGLALATALLWTVHPVATETVVYVVQRTESLMALCLLATLYAFLRGTSSARPGPWLAASVAACALGMGAKEVMVAAPLVVLCADALFVTGSFAASLRARAAFYAGLAASWGVLGLLLSAGQAARATGLDLDLGVTPLQYLWTQSRVLLHYLRLVVWPHPLVLCYDWAPVRSLSEAWPTVALVGALFVATAYGVARRLPAAFAGAVFFLVLAPTSSLLPIPTELVAERRMYLPLAAVLALVVIGAHRLVVRAAGASRRVVGPALVGVATVALGATAFARVLDYRTEESIWRDTVEKSPDSSVVRNNYGRALANLGRQDDAIAQYREGLRLAPGDARTWAKLGNALAEQGKLAEAVDAYRAALRHEPTDEKTHNNLARVLLRVGDLPGAIAHLQEAVRLDPSYALGRLNLAKLLANAGRLAEARAELERVLAMPEAPDRVRDEAASVARELTPGLADRAGSGIIRP